MFCLYIKHQSKLRYLEAYTFLNKEEQNFVQSTFLYYQRPISIFKLVQELDFTLNVKTAFLSMSIYENI